jgi:GNAT superfamily N-acetyltransferase
MASPTVWIAGADDVAPVTALMDDFRAWMGYDDLPGEGIRGVVERLIRDPQTDYLLAASEEGAAAAGICQLRYRLSVWTATDDCWLEDLFVRDGARGRGLGRALVDAAVERARARGCKRIELDVDERDERALAFYRAMGFTLEPKPPGRNLFIGRRLRP